MKELTSRLPKNTILAVKVDQDLYNTGVVGLEMYPILPPFFVSIYFFPADDYLLNYEDRVLDDFCSIDGCFLNIEFKYFVKQCLMQDPKMLTTLFFKSSAYFYKDFYGRALLDYRDMFSQKPQDSVAIYKLTKEILYDYILNNRTDK